jgi:transcription termination factor Rho
MTVDSRTIERADLEGKVLPELQQIAEGLGLEGHQRLRKSDLIDAIVAKSSTDGHGSTAAEAAPQDTVTENAPADAGAESAEGRGDGSGPRGGSSRRSEGDRGSATAVARR